MITLFLIGGIMALLLLSIFIVVMSIQFDENHIVDSQCWHARLFRIISNKYKLPNNVCSYFWLYVMYLLVLPFNILTIIVNLFIKDYYYKVPFIMGIICILVFGMIGLLGMDVALTDNVLFNFMSFALGFPTMLGGILFGGFYTAEAIARRNKLRHKGRKQPKTSLLKAKFKSFKEKNCSIIKWY